MISDRPTQRNADNPHGRSRPLRTIGTLRADFILARSKQLLYEEAEDTSAVAL
jgi:hypothetical protein